MSLGYEGDMGRASNYTGQWRPFSYSGGHRLRPPSRTLWTDPDYPSGPNPQRPVWPGHFPPKKTHFSGQRFPDTVPLNCENFPHNRERGEKDTPNPPTSLIPHTPHRHTWESKGAQPHPRNPAQYPGISCGPLSETPLSLLLWLIQTELVWIHCKRSTAQEKQSDKLNFNLLWAHISVSPACTQIPLKDRAWEFVKYSRPHAGRHPHSDVRKGLMQQNQWVTASLNMSI